jgi:hypothetical protein
MCLLFFLIKKENQESRTPAAQAKTASYASIASAQFHNYNNSIFFSGE